MTAEGAEQLKEELNNLKSIERPKITLAIKEAREKGDLKENAESVSYTHLTLPTILLV